ncbi:hypothetical protein ACM66Z_04145 [Sulfurovum sp. ST-21]|uniref:Uncharacterized protein n=1 Tax=Sulfurovum indicum TaxID=2779528 RepID=A0A7M1S5Q9_9BACT|nr:hypothetical protein [Sulfurovum indicum]QOR62666.1 hypothetical protein IMZ28_04130 [Sulfurovum indicum]
MMIVRENEMYGKDVRFTGNDISLAATMLDKLSTTIEIIYYLMNRREERSFVVMLISSDEFDVGKIVKEQKRNTDILFKLDEERSIYAIICQDTKIDGGYRFAERVMHHLRENEVKEPYCVELEIRNTTYDIKYIIFKLIEIYIETKENKRSNEIVFKSLH